MIGGEFAYSLAPGACLGFRNAPLSWLLLDVLWAASASSPGVHCQPQPQPQAQLSVDEHLPLVFLSV